MNAASGQQRASHLPAYAKSSGDHSRNFDKECETGPLVRFFNIKMPLGQLATSRRLQDLYARAFLQAVAVRYQAFFLGSGLN